MLRKNIISRILLTVSLTVLFSSLAVAQSWDVPADKKAKNSYIKFEDSTEKEGQAIYQKNCASCHGDIGKGNYLKSLNPVPPDLSSTNTQNLTDGELFYILSTGRGAMPNFKNILSESDRWKSIGYIRSFNNSYVQVVSKTDPSKSNLVKINLNYDSIKGEIKVQVSATEKSGVIALKDAEVVVFAKRYFGRLQIDKTLRTDNNGAATFKFAKDLPGDKTGNIELIVIVNDETYGEIESQSKLKIGVPTDKPSLTEKRAIWNVLAKAPLWIIFLYTFGVLTFGMFFLFLIYNLWKLKKTSEKN